MRLKQRIIFSGSIASIASTGALAYCGYRELLLPFAPINAISHWIWPCHAMEEKKWSFKFTVTGFTIHTLSAIFWAGLFETLNRSPASKKLAEKAALTAAVAALTDLKVVPRRISPGFENKISGTAVLGVYATFGLALYLGSVVGRMR